MIVVKLGGSLLQADTLPNCLNKVGQNYQGRAVVIVPGGGPFADQVRLAQQQLKFDDYTAHCMALLAMQQMALLFKSQKQDFAIARSVPEIHQLLPQNKPVIWSPAIAELDLAGVPGSWDITSDSLAAWLAGKLNAKELVLVKSAEIDRRLSLQQLAKQGVIDLGFCGLVQDVAFKIRIINQDNF
ncbi:MAG: uridylate kinase [Methylococcales bacterium]|nr:uridylate kinase [Methylococcales bacterium]